MLTLFSLTFFSSPRALTPGMAAGPLLVPQPASATARRLLSASLLVPLLLACGASGGVDNPPSATGGGGGLPEASGGTFASGGAGSAPAGTGSGSSDIVVPPATGGTGGEPNGNPPTMILTELPAGFTPAEGAANGSDAADLRGGFQLVGALADVGDASTAACANVLRVLVRDFVTFTHPDFGGLKPPGDAAGLVAPTLDAGRKPIRTDALPTVAVQFEDWYTNVDGTNTPYVVDLWLEPDAGAFVYDSSRFFPLDAAPVSADDDQQADLDRVLRNFGFTTELHTAFEYKGGEVFTFRGDDDVFVFVDNQLVVDLGGVHGPVEGSVSIDSLGLTLGQVYNFDLFQAERNPTGSNFRLETTLDFTECGVILPDDVVH